MSLRLRFLILVVGSFLVPAFVFFISFQLDMDVESFREYRAIVTAHHEWRDNLQSTVFDRDNLTDPMEILSWPAEVRVFDEEGNELFSRKPIFSDVDERRFYITESVPINFIDGSKGLIVVTRPPNPFNQNADLWYVPLTGLLFFAIMVIFFGQSINRSIGNLEKATRQIAGGDLDFELPIKGNDKLASLTRSFDSMRQHLKEEYARRSRFIMGISHDLKTPLSSISGYIEAIKDGYADSPEKLTKYVGIIDDKTDLLASRISMLIDYVKKETAEWKIDLKPVEIRPFIEELSKVFESETSLKNRVFSSSVDVRPGFFLLMDEDMVIRALENIMQNALHYSPEHSKINFSCLENPEGITIALTNQGEGISAHDLPYVFDPFVRGAAGRNGTGFGLGLATVESVISSHGWKVEVESEPDVRTVFSVIIPSVNISK
ncbi:MAG: HAMP domain-containing histidine kinase [Spirochaetales bacterium]|jgi:signal transduction histidine kinase|nr:HAMP domain-containing histidine kinase [Spirochaetales bacterium]